MRVFAQITHLETHGNRKKEVERNGNKTKNEKGEQAEREGLKTRGRRRRKDDLGLMRRSKTHRRRRRRRRGRRRRKKTTTTTLTNRREESLSVFYSLSLSLSSSLLYATTLKLRVLSNEGKGTQKAGSRGRQPPGFASSRRSAHAHVDVFFLFSYVVCCSLFVPGLYL